MDEKHFCEINNRRYLGNKYRLLPFISRTIAEHCSDINVFADLFAGTGAVSSAFSDKTLITNDILYSNYLCNYAWFGAQKADLQKVDNLLQNYNKWDVSQDNYMSENFGGTFFSHTDCAKIGAIRDDIETLFAQNKLNEREKSILITSLLYAMDRIAKTCGHYDAFRRGALFDMQLELRMPNVANNNNPQNKCYNQDINELASKIKADIVYLDPPYNSRQYCDAYHLLENVARWNKPKVFGVARKMNRGELKSAYCTRKAPNAFKRLIESIDARYILLSYNNMAKKGNDRSNARISDESIINILSAKGELQIFEESYKPFTTGKSDIANHTERLFLCKCF